MKRLMNIACVLLLVSCISPGKPSDDASKVSATTIFPTIEEAENHLKEHKACRDCDLRRAELSYADLRGADLQKANLRGADLSHADLRGAKLVGAILIRADLSTGTRLEGADLRGSDLTEANISQKELKLAQTCDAKLPDGTMAPPCKDHLK